MCYNLRYLLLNGITLDNIECVHGGWVCVQSIYNWGFFVAMGLGGLELQAILDHDEAGNNGDPEFEISPCGGYVRLRGYNSQWRW